MIYMKILKKGGGSREKRNWVDWDNLLLIGLNFTAGAIKLPDLT
jgi:hypothetical protein